MNEKGDKPFFLAVGLVKPHMPFSVPKKWFDMFPLESIQLPPHREDDLNDVPPAGVKMAGRRSREDRGLRPLEGSRAGVPRDDCVLRLASRPPARRLEKSPQRDNTIVCLWSDHGWSLGEKSHWRKFALWEEPTRTVFVWKVPGVTPSRWRVRSAGGLHLHLSDALRAHRHALRPRTSTVATSRRC